MNSVSVLHCADLHLGSKISFLGHKSDTLQSEQLLCFERIINLCNQNKTEVLIISGDLFDGFNVDNSLILKVIDLINGLKHTITVLCAGNHDPLGFGASPVEKVAANTKAVILSDESPLLEIGEKNLRIYGGSFSGAYLKKENPFSQFDIDPSFLNIAVLHADLAADQNSNYNPVSVRQIENSGMDYVALGHIHKRTDILKAGNTFYAYSGCVQGTGFDELGQKGVYIGKISKGRCDLEFVNIAKRLFLSEEIDITECSTDNEVVVKIRADILNLYKDSAADNLYKITLIGRLSEDFCPDISFITAALGNDYFYIKVRDNTEAKIDLIALSKQNTLKGMFVKRMLELMDSAEDKESLTLALKIGLKAFDGEVKAIDN